jgi:hypothetical protein
MKDSVKIGVLMPQHWHWQNQQDEIRQDVRYGGPDESSLPVDAVTGDR